MSFLKGLFSNLFPDADESESKDQTQLARLGVLADPSEASSVEMGPIGHSDSLGIGSVLFSEDKDEPKDGAVAKSPRRSGVSNFASDEVTAEESIHQNVIDEEDLTAGLPEHLRTAKMKTAASAGFATDRPVVFEVDVDQLLIINRLSEFRVESLGNNRYALTASTGRMTPEEFGSYLKSKYGYEGEVRYAIKKQAFLRKAFEVDWVTVDQARKEGAHKQTIESLNNSYNVEIHYRPDAVEDARWQAWEMGEEEEGPMEATLKDLKRALAEMYIPTSSSLKKASSDPQQDMADDVMETVWRGIREELSDEEISDSVGGQLKPEDIARLRAEDSLKKAGPPVDLGIDSEAPYGRCWECGEALEEGDEELCKACRENLVLELEHPEQEFAQVPDELADSSINPYPDTEPSLEREMEIRRERKQGRASQKQAYDANSAEPSDLIKPTPAPTDPYKPEDSIQDNLINPKSTEAEPYSGHDDHLKDQKAVKPVTARRSLPSKVAAYWQEYPVEYLIEHPPSWARESPEDWKNAVMFAAEHSKRPGETANLGHALKSYKDLHGTVRPLKRQVPVQAAPEDVKLTVTDAKSLLAQLYRKGVELNNKISEYTEKLEQELEVAPLREKQPEAEEVVKNALARSKNQQVVFEDLIFRLQKLPHGGTVSHATFRNKVKELYGILDEKIKELEEASVTPVKYTDELEVIPKTQALKLAGFWSNLLNKAKTVLFSVKDLNRKFGRSLNELNKLLKETVGSTEKESIMLPGGDIPAISEKQAAGQMYDVKEALANPPKWVTDLVLWEQAVGKASKKALFDYRVNIVTALAIYKALVARKERESSPAVV